MRGGAVWFGGVGVERFVQGEPLRLVHECALGILALVCSACLLAAFAGQRQVVDEATVKTVLAAFPGNELGGTKVPPPLLSVKVS